MSLHTRKSRDIVALAPAKIKRKKGLEKTSLKQTRKQNLPETMTENCRPSRPPVTHIPPRPTYNHYSPSTFWETASAMVNEDAANTSYFDGQVRLETYPSQLFPFSYLRTAQICKQNMQHENLHFTFPHFQHITP